MTYPPPPTPAPPAWPGGEPRHICTKRIRGNRVVRVCVVRRKGGKLDGIAVRTESDLIAAVVRNHRARIVGTVPEDRSDAGIDEFNGFPPNLVKSFRLVVQIF